ncbi:hypothetical protein KUG88_26885 [Rhodococcus rhodochrous]|uniref:LGFP repeat-containing protein n=1 Tax=Rhodococcus rhodochrous TaxID=1829 RepID=UPI0027E0EC40|nr:hypothetical protein [Rhodococcus rhodochrous]MCB8913746.1 hypothetical protein [Rhodococcus rhodochrous]
MRDVWAQHGREDGELGYPQSDEQIAADGVGHYAEFESRDAIYSVLGGAWRVPWKVLSVWTILQKEQGALGYPDAAARNNISQGIEWRQKFQNGEITIGDDGYVYFRHY